jgi:NAD(P)-dependent dehydrogenase (short-subunit alcohol dehydrogenase family)
VDTRNLAGRTALVTGAGSGIGRETALALGRAGADLVICDLNLDNLERTAADLRSIGRTVLARRVDVARRDDMAAFAAEVHRDRAAVDILVNNAGVGLGARFQETTLEDWDWIVGINLMGVVHGCHFFVPPIVARGQGGHVVNIASSAAFIASSPLTAYCTTKYAVFGLSEALREELRPHAIGVTAVCPGVINTAITRTSRTRGLAAGPGAKERMAELFAQRNYGPERVAANILKGIARNRAVLPVAPEAWALYFVKRFLPGVASWINRTSTARMEREFRKAAGDTAS